MKSFKPMKCLNQIKKYIPRHMRLGLSVDAPEIEAFQDVVEVVPIVDEFGSVVQTQSVLKSLPAHEVMRKYRDSAFRLSALQQSGVPLKMVNINSSNMATIAELRDVCQTLDDADKYVQRIMDERKEREAWLHPELELESDNPK